jgi:hypothetical protein
MSMCGVLMSAAASIASWVIPRESSWRNALSSRPDLGKFASPGPMSLASEERRPNEPISMSDLPEADSPTSPSTSPSCTPYDAPPRTSTHPGASCPPSSVTGPTSPLCLQRS